MRKTPEIPRDVFFEKPDSEDVKQSSSQNGKQSKGQAGKTSRRQAVKTVSSQAVKTASQEKVQVTVYLTPEALRALETARFELLTQHGRKVSKSAIVQAAILQAAGDLGALEKLLPVEE